jgi:hypothetical protein
MHNGVSTGDLACAIVALPKSKIAAKKAEYQRKRMRLKEKGLRAPKGAR